MNPGAKVGVNVCVMTSYYKNILDAFTLVFLILVVTTSPAAAYIGPGLGAGTIAVVLGIIGSVFLALFAIIYYPIKRMLRRKKQSAKSDTRQQ